MAAHIAKITPLTSRVIRVLGCNPGPMTLQGTNTYIIGTGNRRVLLDAGEKGNAEYISSLISVLKQHNTTIDKIIISHWHNDHLGGLQDVLSSLGDDINVYKFPRVDAPDASLLESVKLVKLRHKEEIKTEGATLIAHHTPGHTTDHVVLELKEERSVFSGDCILGEGTTVFEDLYTYMNSLKLILDLQPEVVYPGHGPVIVDPMVRIQYYIDHRNEREGQILKVLADSPKKYLTPMELVKLIYKDVPEHLHQAAENNVKHHLQKLFKENLIHSKEDSWCLSNRKHQL